MNYIIIRVDDDGIHVMQFSPGDLQHALIHDWAGDTFIDRIPCSNPNEWGCGSTLIIKGEIVVPKAKKVVTQWEI